MSRSADTAHTLILIGVIFQAITVLVLLAVGLFLLIIPFLGGIVLLLAFLALIWLILVYVYSYARTRDGYYEEARTPTLVFGVLSLFSGGVISGVLYIVAYLKLGDAADEEDRRKSRRMLSRPSPALPPTPAMSPTGPRPTYSVANSAPFLPPSSPPAATPVTSDSNFCSNCGRPTPSKSRFCRNCGAALQ